MPAANRPDRWLVDLSDDAEVLLPPQAYPDLALPEDRLFVPAEYVPPLWNTTDGSAGRPSSCGHGRVRLDSAAPPELTRAT